MCVLAFVSHLSCLLSEGVRRRRLHGDFGSPDLQHLKLLRQADTNTHFQCTASAHSRKQYKNIPCFSRRGKRKTLQRTHDMHLTLWAEYWLCSRINRSLSSSLWPSSEVCCSSSSPLLSKSSTLAFSSSICHRETQGKRANWAFKSSKVMRLVIPPPQTVLNGSQIKHLLFNKHEENIYTTIWHKLCLFRSLSNLLPV